MTATDPKATFEIAHKIFENYRAGSFIPRFLQLAGKLG
jgi:hypothetical protein